MTLKGLPEAVPVSEVTWEPLVGPGVPVPALLDEVEGIFVGRKAELERLSRLWKDAEAGGRCIALLAGEPGAGKTRLAAQVARRVHAEGGVVLAGRCDEDLGVPFQPFVEALRHLVDHIPDHELLGRLGRFPGELVRLVPELAVRLAALPPPLQADPETERYRLFDAVATWLATASRDRPVLLVLDDMHWAAKSTLLMLRHLLRPPGVPRLLVIATYRDTEIHPGHPLAGVLADLRRQEGVERFSVSGLNQDGVAALMAETASHPLRDEDLALAHAIQRETEGNPFFVREVLRHLTEIGAIEPTAGRWALDRPLTDLGIPEGVREVVLRRIGRLSQTTAAVLLTAAIAGRHFDIDVVAEASAIEVEAALDALDGAISAGLVTENDQQPGWFSFTHALVTEALYETTTQARRTRRHRRIGAAAARVWAGHPERAAEIARHWLLAAELDAATAAQACAYAAAAARVADARLAPEDAAELWQQALTAADLAENVDRYPLLIGRATSLYRAGHHLDGLPVFVRAINHAFDEGGTQGTSRLVTAAVAAMGESNWYPITYGLVDEGLVDSLQRALPRLTDPVQHALVLSCLAAAYYYDDNPQRRAALSDQALNLARPSADDASLARVLRLRAMALRTPDHPAQCLAATTELLELPGLPPPLMAAARLLRVDSLAMLANIPETTAEMDRAAALAEQLQSQPILMQLSWVRAGLLLLAGRWSEAEVLSRAAFDLNARMRWFDGLACRAAQRWEAGFLTGTGSDLVDELRTAAEVTGIPALRSVLAMALVEAGRADEAREVLSRLQPGPKDYLWLPAQCWALLAASQLGETELVIPLRDQLLPYRHLTCVTGSVITLSGAVAYFTGEAALALGEPDAAMADLTIAIEIDERMGARPWLARARDALTRDQATVASPEVVYEELSPVTVWRRDVRRPPRDPFENQIKGTRRKDHHDGRTAQCGPCAAAGTAPGFRVAGFAPGDDCCVR